MNKWLLALLLFPGSSPHQEDREVVRKVHEAVKKSFVGIEITLRKKTRLEKTELEEEQPDPETQQILLLTENRQTLDAWGIAIEKDVILMPDRAVAAADMEKIEVTDPSGARFEAKFQAVGRNHDFVLLKPSEPRDLVPLAFGEGRRPALGEAFYVTFAERVDHQWHVNVSPYIQTNAPLGESKDWFCIDAIRPGSVVSDKDGATMGVALDQHLWRREDGRSSFIGKDILADERVPDFEARYESFRKALPASVKRVEILLRAEQGNEFMVREDGKADRLTLYGAALDEQTLFIPQDLPRDLIRKIDDIKVVQDKQRVPATFVGAFKNFGGIVLRAEGLQMKPGIERLAVAPPPGQLYFTATIEDRFGRDRMKFDYNRLFRTEKGLNGAPRLQPRKRIKAGSFLLDFDGRIIGCATVDKKEEDIDEVAAESSRERYYSRGRSYQQDYLRRTVFFSEIDGILSSPAAHFDPKAVPMSKKEEKKLVWLGVEFQEFSKPLAEALGVQERDLTNDGRRGLIVTDIYPNSPAAKAGLKVDDILLSVQAEGETTARDLVADRDRFGGMGGWNPRMRGGTEAAPWRPTRNYLTTMLTEIGATKKVTFQYARAKEKSSVALTLEYAPTDYEIAEKSKDDALGFTVKELTYDVRYFQKLDPAAKGMVVAKVESGSKADVAKLSPLSVIHRVNDVAVQDLAHFKQLVGASKNLTLTTGLYGQTRLVELSRE